MTQEGVQGLAALLEKAFDRAAAKDANEAIGRVRASLGEQVRSFEVVVPPDAAAQWLGEKVVPRLVYHLESLGIRPPKYPGMFATLFVGEEILFVQVKDVMEFAGAALGLTADQMYERWGTGEARHAIDLHAEEAPEKKPSGPPLALPAGKPG